jgi:hypothetical protein
MKDRVTMLPQALRSALQAHLAVVEGLHERDLIEGFGEVYLPFALARKYPSAPREWGWQYVFPAARLSTDPRSGVRRRHHFDEKRALPSASPRVSQPACRTPIPLATLRSPSRPFAQFFDSR